MRVGKGTSRGVLVAASVPVGLPPLMLLRFSLLLLLLLGSCPAGPAGVWRMPHWPQALAPQERTQRVGTGAVGGTCVTPLPLVLPIPIPPLAPVPLLLALLALLPLLALAATASSSPSPPAPPLLSSTSTRQ